jgi:hypothetical protein
VAGKKRLKRLPSFSNWRTKKQPLCFANAES